VIYLSAGLYAEGPSDYGFLLRLIDRMLETIGAAQFSGACEVATTIGIDAPEPLRTGKRAPRIAAAVAAYEGQFELLVIHADGASDPRAARRSQIDPGIAALAEAATEWPVIAVPCIPVREIEAWLLTDPGAFRQLLGSSAAPALPADPEREADPKATLTNLVKAGGAHFSGSIYPLFGEHVALTALRKLPAFCEFEADLTAAIRDVARAQGHRPSPR
jgi:hypothetical protein